MWCHETTRLTCAGGGTTLTSLRKGRRHAAAFLRRVESPAITDNHPRPLGEVGGAGNSSNVRRVAVVPVGGGQVSSHCNTLLKYITYLLGDVGALDGQESGRERRWWRLRTKINHVEPLLMDIRVRQSGVSETPGHRSKHC